MSHQVCCPVMAEDTLGPEGGGWVLLRVLGASQSLGGTGFFSCAGLRATSSVSWVSSVTSHHPRAPPALVLDHLTGIGNISQSII